MYLNKENEFVVLNHEKNRDYHEIKVCLIWWMNIDSEENSGNKSFSWKTKVPKLCIPMRRMCSLCPISKRLETISRIHICQIWGINFDCKEIEQIKAFLAKLKHQNRVFKRGEHVYSVKKRKEWRLSRESKLILFDGQTLIPRKIPEIKAFLVEPKHQNYVLQWEEYYYSAQSPKD